MMVRSIPGLMHLYCTHIVYYLGETFVMDILWFVMCRLQHFLELCVHIDNCLLTSFDQGCFDDASSFAMQGMQCSEMK